MSDVENIIAGIHAERVVRLDISSLINELMTDPDANMAELMGELLEAIRGQPEDADEVKDDIQQSKSDSSVASKRFAIVSPDEVKSSSPSASPVTILESSPPSSPEPDLDGDSSNQSAVLNELKRQREQAAIDARERELRIRARFFRLDLYLNLLHCIRNTAAASSQSFYANLQQVATECKARAQQLRDSISSQLQQASFLAFESVPFLLSSGSFHISHFFNVFLAIEQALL